MPPLKIWSLLVGCIFFLELLFDIWGFPLETVFRQSPCGIGVHDWRHMDFPSTSELNLVFLILHEYISCCFLPKLIFYAFSTLNSYICLLNNDFHHKFSCPNQVCIFGEKIQWILNLIFYILKSIFHSQIGFASLEEGLDALPPNKSNKLHTFIT